MAGGPLGARRSAFSGPRRTGLINQFILEHGGLGTGESRGRASPSSPGACGGEIGGGGRRQGPTGTVACRRYASSLAPATEPQPTGWPRCQRTSGSGTHSLSCLSSTDGLESAMRPGKPQPHERVRAQVAQVAQGPE